MNPDETEERARLDACLGSIDANLESIGDRLNAYARDIQDSKSHMVEPTSGHT